MGASAVKIPNILEDSDNIVSYDVPSGLEESLGETVGSRRTVRWCLHDYPFYLLRREGKDLVRQINGGQAGLREVDGVLPDEWSAEDSIVLLKDNIRLCLIFGE